MTSVVVDAVAAVKWCSPSLRVKLVAEAEELLASNRRDEIRLLVPDLFWVELANALWKAVGRAEIAADKDPPAISFVCDLGIATVLPGSWCRKPWNVAATTGQTVRLSQQVALAMQSKTELVTADERLANARAARLPVRWLGAC